MLDGVSAKLPPKIETIMALPLKFKFDTSSGEIHTIKHKINNGEKVITPQTAEVNKIGFYYGKGLLNFNNGRSVEIENLCFKGSIHKYHNKGVHNYNDYTYTDFINDVRDLQAKYHVTPETTKIRALEWGVNIRVPLSVNLFLNEVKTLKRADYTINTYQNGKALYFHFQEYTLKLYSKGDQWNLGNNLLRVELKIKKSEYLKRLGISTLADLTNIQAWHSLETKLLNVFNSLVVCRFTRKDRLTKMSEKVLLAKFENKDFWQGLTSNQFKHYRKSKLLDSGKMLVAEISKIIAKKCKELRQ